MAAPMEMSESDKFAIELVNGKLGDDIKSLKSVKELYKQFKDKQKTLESKLSLASTEVPNEIDRAISDAEEARNDVKRLGAKKEELYHAIQDSGREVSSLMKKTSKLTVELSELEHLTKYLSCLVQIGDLSSKIEMLLQSERLPESVERFTELSTMYTTLETSSCHNLVKYAKDTTVFWYKILKNKIASEFEEVLKQLRWPLVAMTIKAPPAQNPAEVKVKMEQLFKQLLKLQLPHSLTAEVEQLHPQLAQFSGMRQPILPIQLMIKPLRRRFKFHFYGNKQTNDIGKPEWYFTQILSWLRDHLDFLDQRIQPLLREAGKQQIDSKTMEALMSHILLNAARAKQPVESSASSSDWNKYTRHTCDRLVEPTDLRSTSDTGYTWHQPSLVVATPSRSSCDSDGSSLNESSVSSVCSDDSVYIKREVESPEARPPPHPFSIEALLGDSKYSVGEKCFEPAVVYSAYSCQSASDLYTSSESLSGYEVTEDVSFWCHVCNALCMDFKDAQAHQYLHQAQGIRCNLRKMLFLQHGYVSKHTRVDDEKIQCGLCDKIVAHCFFTKHQRLHDGHFCEICKREFASNSRLLDHMNIHTGSTPFSCNICNRKFAKRSSLTQHQRYHRDHQSFKCGYCPKAFNSKYARAVHERLHTGENPFKCQVPGCSRAFPQKIQLQLHMNSH